MEKLTNEWAAKHGKIENDGLARLKELLNNIKGKVESIGDVGGHPGANIMGAEESIGKDVADKKWLDKANKTPSNNPVVKGAKKAWDWVTDPKESVAEGNTDDLSRIRKLSGLAK
jgi:uncharacterized protein YjbJ (UPF0337 family)